MGCASAQWVARPAKGPWLAEYDVRPISVKSCKQKMVAQIAARLKNSLDRD
jgi:hypothetical protein